VVDELGPGTSGRLSKGQRVVSADWGLASWQEYAAVDEKLLVSCSVTQGFACLHQRFAIDEKFLVRSAILSVVAVIGNC